LVGLVGIALLFYIYVSAAIMTFRDRHVSFALYPAVYTLIIAGACFFKQRSLFMESRPIVMALAGGGGDFPYLEISWASFGLGIFFGLLSDFAMPFTSLFVRTFSPRYGLPW
jgi:hypothetical protein